MDEQVNEQSGQKPEAPVDVKNLVRDAISEFMRFEQSKAEPVYKTELAEERKRRETLERTVKDLIDENRRSRQIAEEMERSSAIRNELQKLGVTKVDLAYKAVKDDIRRLEDGRLVAQTDEGELGAKEFLNRFVNENPELLPARVAGGSGATPTAKVGTLSTAVDLDKIKPGMSTEELERVREEIARVASQALRGL